MWAHVCICVYVYACAADSTVFARIDPDGFTVINSRVRRTRFKVHIRVVEATWAIVDITMLSYDPTGQHSCIRISRFNGSPGCNRLTTPCNDDDYDYDDGGQGGNVLP